MRIRSKMFVAFLLIIGFNFLSGCKKQDINSANSSIANNTQSNIVDKILAYLESQKIATVNARTTTTKNANIDLLKENLDFTAARTELLDNRLDLLIVPIKDEIIAKKNLDGNSTLTLLLITDKLGKIKSGSIVYFQPSDGKKHSSLPQNTFSNMFSGKVVEFDGIYKMLTVTGRWISQFEIKKGKIYSTGSILQKNQNNKRESNQKTQGCIDWYLVTSYYENGILVDQTWEYVGTTCDGCSDPNYQSICPDDGGGGGDPQPDEIIDGDDNISGSSGILPDASSGLNLSGTGLIPLTFTGHVRYVFNRTQGVVISVTGAKPNVIPVSQPFTDSNGDPAVVYYSIGVWNFGWTLLSPGVFYASYTFDCVHNYVFLSGSRVFTFTEGLSKVVSCW